MLKVILFVLAVYTPLNAAVLTGAVNFSSDATGNFAGGQLWNTVAGDTFYNLYLLDGGGFVNTGNGASLPLNVNLTSGNTYVFALRGEPGAANAFFSLNLFFDGGVAPAISVVAPQNTSGSFAAATGAASALPNGGTAPASGTLTFDDGSTQIVLSDYFWNTQGQSGNQVQAYDSTPGGANDFAGGFTLSVRDVQNVPEPGTLLLLGLGLAVTALAGRRR